MKKFNDIFSIDSSTRGSKKLIKKIINKYRLGNEYKEIKENIENKGSSGGSSEEKEWLYYKLNRETDETAFSNVLTYLYDLYLAVYFNEGVTETISCYSSYPYNDGNYAGYLRVPKQDFVTVQWSDNDSFIQTIYDKKYFKEFMLMLFPHIEEITKEEYYSIVTIPIEQYPKSELPL